MRPDTCFGICGNGVGSPDTTAKTFFCRQPSIHKIIMTEAVTVTLSPNLVQKLNEFRREGDAGYEDIIVIPRKYLVGFFLKNCR